MNQEIYNLIKTNPLMKNISNDEFTKMIPCMNGTLQSYKKEEAIMMSGDPFTSIGLIIAGDVQIYKEDMNGKQILMTSLSSGDLYGEVFACANIEEIPVSVIAVTDCKIFHLNFQKMMTICSSACVFHSQLIKNMLFLMAKKNLMLNDKIEILSKRTTRERLLYFFYSVSKGRSKFTLPLNREELAAFLCVDRSAMSAELSKMQKDGYIKYNRNEIELLKHL